MAALKDKIQHVLEETRVVLPGTQALLGFQFVAIFSNGFEKLTEQLKVVHLVSLLLVICSTILLMTSASYHRIVEEGEDTTALHRFASVMIVGAMITLSLGVCLDVFVIFQSVLKSISSSLLVSLGLLALFYSFWFGYPLYKKSARE